MTKILKVSVRGRGTDWFNHGVKVESAFWMSRPLMHVRALEKWASKSFK